MSLYDDFDKHRAQDKVAGWSSGIKLLQSQLQLKKAAVPAGKRELNKKATVVLAPVIDLKTKSREIEKDDDGIKYFANTVTPIGIANEFDWNVANEYDPQWPNEYEKAVKDLREMRDREHDNEMDNSMNVRKRMKPDRGHFDDPPLSNISNLPSMSNMSNMSSMSSMSSIAAMRNEDRDEERTSFRSSQGAAIAPPPSLQDSPEPVAQPPPTPPHKPSLSQGYATSSIAAKIMAKYGFKEGQGLGKKEQGMSVALQVEKTSKRGGRIVGEKEQLMPPPPPLVSSPPSNSQGNPEEIPSITELLKTPSKVVLLRNMVGPGEVDDDLEPEVKDECNTKYGDVTKVLIHEVLDAVPEDAVRIFVEFKRIESAVKAVVDLNGRFFGGRQVRAGFYSVEKLNKLQLLD